MPAQHLKFFPRFTFPAPNGNGKAAHAPEAKAVHFTPGISFVPLDALSHTIDLRAVGPLAWYRSAWLAYACMKYRAEKLKEAPLWITEEKDGEEGWLEGDHDLAVLLERPNPDQRAKAFLETHSLYMDATGACLWVINRDRADRIASIYCFPHGQFSAKPADGRVYGRFEVHTADGTRVFEREKLKDVIQFRYTDPADPYSAVAPLDAALARLDIDRELVASMRAGIRNSVVPGMTFVFPADFDPTDQQKAEYKASISAQYAEARNHGKPIVTGGGIVATRHELGFSGLEGGELNKENEAAICAAFQIPPVVIGAYVGLENSSDRHNLETSVTLVYDNVILPAWSMIEEGMTDGLLREVDDNPLRFIRFDKSRIKALQTDRTAAAAVISKSKEALRRDDARAMLGLEPLGGELGEALLVGAVPPAAPGAEGEKGAAPQAKAFDRDATRWTLHDAVARAQEAGWEIAAASQLAEDRREVLALAEASLTMGGKALGPALETKDDAPLGPADTDSVRDFLRKVADYFTGPAVSAWRTRIEPLTRATARPAVQNIAAEMGVSFDLLQPGLLDFVERETGWLVKEINETTRSAIREAMATGLEAGESIPDLTKRIQESGAFARSRAELIARTETIRASNGAAQESLAAYAESTGEKVRKRWLSAGDDRVRPEHAELNGEPQDIGDPFSNGLMYPSEPNCRCTVVHTLEAAA